MEREKEDNPTITQYHAIVILANLKFNKDRGFAPTLPELRLASYNLFFDLYKKGPSLEEGVAIQRACFELTNSKHFSTIGPEGSFRYEIPLPKRESLSKGAEKILKLYNKL